MTLSRNVPLTRKPGLYLQRTPFPQGSAGLARTPWSRSVPGITQAGCNTGSRTAISPAAGIRVKSSATKSATGNLLPVPPSEFTPKVKRLVRRRAGRGDEFDAVCEAGGEWLGIDAGEFQHRAARGAGGCRDTVINGPSNCCLLCPECHRRAETRDPHMGMDEGGFWLEHGTTPAYDPRLVPILLMSPGGSGLPVYLAADGLGEDGTGYLLQRPELELIS